MEVLEKKIKFLIESKLGDSNRLKELLERVKSGKQLYNSDITYIERLSAIETEIEKLNPKLTNSKLQIPDSKSIPISNNKPTITQNILNVNWPYAVSYNTSHSDEVKIHAGKCAHVARASQIGPTKWIFVENLKEALSTANQIYSKYGSWRFPRCCLYRGATFFECKNCSRYSDGPGNTKKKHTPPICILAVCMIFLPSILFHFTFFGNPFGVETNFVLPIFFINIILFFIGILVLIIENATAKRVCKNCNSINWKRLE